MSLDRPINIELDEYFRLMKRQFTPDEWRQIDKASNRLHEFYRWVIRNDVHVELGEVWRQYRLCPALHYQPFHIMLVDRYFLLDLDLSSITFDAMTLIDKSQVVYESMCAKG